MMLLAFAIIVLALGIFTYSAFRDNPKEDVDLFVRWLTKRNGGRK